MEFDFDLCGGIYPTRAQDIKELMRTRRAGAYPALALCIRRLYVTTRHTQMTGIADHALSRHFGRAQHDQATLPATCKRRALDGVAGFGEAMKGDGVKRLRKEEITGRDKRCEAEGGVYWRLRSSRLALT